MTFSIAAVDPNTGNVGVAVTTSSIAVGSRCPWVRAGVGAVSSQNITDPNLGKLILDRIEAGESATDAVEKVVQSQENMAYRQLIAVDLQGNVGHHGGELTLGTSAMAAGHGCIAAGNLLSHTGVPAQLIETFSHQNLSDHLAARLVKALQAGIDAGGEEGPVHSAALLVASKYPWPEVDLRVDWDDEDPVGKLAALLEAFEPQREDYLKRAVSPGDAPAYGVPGDL